MNIVIWGHLYGQTTHSWIHNAYNKAFKQFFDPVLWLSDNEASRQHVIHHLDLEKTLFFVEGQQDKYLPVSPFAKYVLHNVDTNKSQYEHLKQYINLQVYTHDVLNRKVHKIAPCEYWQESNRTLYQPWATDLLPHEFDFNTTFDRRSNTIGFVGTVWGGEFGNYPELSKIYNKYGANFQCVSDFTDEQNKVFIRSSLVAPAIQGEWQVKHGYIPCRIFKNISYGHFGVTNNPTVKEMLPFVLYNPEVISLITEAVDLSQHITDEEIIEQMKFIRDNHTYINRIRNINKYLDIGL